MAYPLGTISQNANNWTETITATGTWTAPTIATDGFTISSMSIEVIGAGGSGGASSGLASSTPGAGGGGGAYSKLNSFNPGTTGTNYTATVGTVAADSWFSTTGTVLAKGGTSGSTTTPGTGGASGSGVGDTKNSGGNGGAGSGITGGGGGGGAGSTGAGGAASGTTAGTGTSVGGGNGGASSAAGAVQGGAGGGAPAITGSAGAGARGYIVLTYNKSYSKSPAESLAAPTDAVSRVATNSRTLPEFLQPSQYSAAVIADTPYLYWRFNDANKAQLATVTDSSGNSHPGNYWFGCSSSDSLLPNDSNKSVRLARGNLGLVYNGPAVIVAGATITIECILNRAALGDSAITSDFMMPFSQTANPTSGQTGAYCFWGGRFGYSARTVGIAPHGNSGAVTSWTDALPAGPNGDGTGQTIHQAIIFNDTAHTAELFLNGVSQGVKTGVSAASTADQSDLRLGSWWAASQPYNYLWDGRIDEFAVYSSALSPTRILAHYNAMSTLVSPTDTVSRIYKANRSIGESISAPTDSVTRRFVGARTVSEGVTAPTDAVARTFVGARTITENVDTPVDVVTRVLHANRTVTESVDAPTDAVTRLAQFNRNIEEVVDAPTDAVARKADYKRSMTEGVDAPTDSVTRTAHFNRDVAEILPGEGGGTVIIKKNIVVLDD